MDPRINPYVPGAGVVPFALIGREEILSDFNVTLFRLQNGWPAAGPLITGPRGSGKTVLVGQLASEARRQGWFTAFEEAIPNLPLPKLVAVLIREILTQMSAKRRIQERVRRAFGILKAFTSVSAFGVELNIDAEKVSGHADTGIIERDLRQLFVEIGEVARLHSTGVLLALDEMHTLGEDGLAVIYSALHQTAQRGLPVALAGAGLFPSWQSGKERDDPTRTTTYPARMATRTYRRLEPLSWTDSGRVLSGPIGAHRVYYSGSALNRATAFCEGNPWMLQMLGAESWNMAAYSPIEEEVVRQASERVDAQLSQWYFPRLLRSCSRQQLSMLRQLAEFDEWAVPIRNLGERRSDEVRYTLSELATQDLVYFPNVGSVNYAWKLQVGFSVPRLREYLRRHH
jgi:AAA ATPase domain